MVTKARALLGYEDKKIGVYSDHSEIAKIDIGTTGPYLFIKQAIDEAIPEKIVQPGSFGLFAIHQAGDGLTPGLARPPRPYESLNGTEGDKDSFTAKNPRPTPCRRRPNHVGEDFPLNRAIYHGDIAKVRKTLKDTHLDMPDSQGYTPLMVAAATDQEQIVGGLIKRIFGPKGKTVIHLACRYAGVALASIFLNIRNCWILETLEAARL